MVKRQDWTPSQVRKYFFDQIRDRRDALERSKRGGPVIEEVTPAVRLWGYLEYVGSFLLEAGIISYKDLEEARAMVKEYDDRLSQLYPGR